MDCFFFLCQVQNRPNLKPTDHTAKIAHWALNWIY